jgi:hypothetical protein
MKIQRRCPLFPCLLPSACLVALLASPPPARAVPPEHGGRPTTGVGEDDETLFLRKVLKEKLKSRREKEKRETTNGACRKALEDDDEENIAKHCKKSPGVTLGAPEQTEIRTGGRKTGRKIRATTRLEYENPGQRFGHEGRDKWDRLVIRPPATGDMTARQFRVASSNTRDKARGRLLLDPALPSSAANDDSDCYDRITGAHERDEGCFEGSGAPRTLRRTLEAVEGGCRHVPTGTLLQGAPDTEEDDCYDASGTLKTSLVELIDEDGESPWTLRTVDGREVKVYDVDGDGSYGEDGFNGVKDGINDDGDCVDRVTGKHLGAAACYDASGALRATLEPLEGGCRHVESGATFEGDPVDGAEDACYDSAGVLKTTLAPLIDEDDGEPVDDDDDGEFDEDGPGAPPPGFQADCRQLGRNAGLPDSHVDAMVTADGGCDLTPVIVKKVNEKVGKKAFQTDDPGAPPEDEDAPPIEYGAETRAVDLTEEVTITCDQGMELDDATGQCIESTQVTALAQARAQLLAPAATGSVRDDAMMGFTFVPPRVRWGLFYKEEVCFWFFGCFTLFEAKIGFDFNIGVGFRLPVEVNVSGVPAAPVLAGSQVALDSTLMPLDFSAAEYESFCLGQSPPMGDPAYCRRFSFPNALVPAQGDEFALRLTAFAGIKIVVVEIPIINWGVDVDADVSEWCSLGLAWLNMEDVAAELPGQGGDIGKAITAAGYNCGTYTTPFGKDEDGEPRQFPLMSFFDQMIRADCAEAFARGETIIVGGETIPLCTGLILGIPGASLGLGLGAQLELGSDLVEAEQTASGDGRLDTVSAPVRYRKSANEPDASVALAPVTVDNYDDREFADDALVRLGDFTYCLNTFSVRVKGQVMFGGILTILPDFDEFTIYRFTLPTGDACVIPIGQHSRTNDTLIRVPVENHALEVIVETQPGDPNAVDQKTLKIKPGEFGDFLLGGRNLGSVADTFDNFSLALSNEIQPTGPFHFTIDPDNDHDGRVDEDDFGPEGQPAAVRDEDNDGVADEDPPDSWRSQPEDLPAQAIFGVQPYQTAEHGLTLRISPFAHPSTRPGRYPFEVKADSREARLLDLAAVDPSGHRRLGASDVGFIEVIAFRDVRLAVTPPEAALKPGLSQPYAVEGSNMGNEPDSMTLTVDFRDSNRESCGLADLGSGPGCPERAWPTRIDPGTWTTAGSLPDHFGPLEPLEFGAAGFAVTVPREWEGMRDTTYEFEVEVESPGRGLDPPVSRAVVVRHAVVATKESMTRYIRHEVLELIAAIEAANAGGVRTGGLQPIAVHPVLQKVDQALALVLSGDLGKASGPLSSGVKVVEAFLHALDAVEAKVPAELAGDWRSRAEAMRTDLEVAAASMVPSAP